MAPKASDIIALIEIFSTSGWNELHVELDGVQLFLSTDPGARLTRDVAAPVARVAAAMASPPPAAKAAAGPAPSGADLGPVPPHWVAVTAPNLGTFYRAPKPGAEPYVNVGDSVTADSEVCLLEVMKLFTAVRAGTFGTIRRICVADAALVEFGAVLFYVEPA